jgi:hypothetical protein
MKQRAVSFYFWCNNAVGPGRICEVGPPASGSSFFTKPLFALRAQRDPISKLISLTFQDSTHLLVVSRNPRKFCKSEAGRMRSRVISRHLSISILFQRVDDGDTRSLIETCIA